MVAVSFLTATLKIKNNFRTGRKGSYYICGFSFKVITVLKSLLYLSFRKASENSGESPDLDKYHLT